MVLDNPDKVGANRTCPTCRAQVTRPPVPNITLDKSIDLIARLRLSPEELKERNERIQQMRANTTFTHGRSSLRHAQPPPGPHAAAAAAQAAAAQAAAAQAVAAHVARRTAATGGTGLRAAVVTALTDPMAAFFGLMGGSGAGAADVAALEPPGDHAGPSRRRAIDRVEAVDLTGTTGAGPPPAHRRTRRAVARDCGRTVAQDAHSNRMSRFRHWDDRARGPSTGQQRRRPRRWGC